MKQHTDKNITDNVTRHPEHEKHWQKQNNDNIWTKTRLRRPSWQRSSKVETINEATSNFKRECKKQPVYIYTSCHRLLWKKGVQKFSIDKYNKIRKEIIQLVLNEEYRIASIDGSI